MELRHKSTQLINGEMKGIMDNYNRHVMSISLNFYSGKTSQQCRNLWFLSLHLDVLKTETQSKSTLNLEFCLLTQYRTGHRHELF